ncbi:uncharacterized protein LOC100379062 [Saccoglossus kowalevskii]|uniref:Uncharacterized protein LOC100379062 n=1 Tax=Saccoglossus kowalevskii TaxID=10224 RepID=A0ABM0ME53_SACKO|nr:PREDICTED: uncharacterized protein LOC100379062 [Saccoglossus kowalevskii]
MVRLTCNCLNVSVHVKESELKPLDRSSLGLSGEHLKDEFFSKDVALVVLDLGGITKEQSCLVEEYQVADWIIHQCLNCKLSSYALHATKGMDRVLVSTSMMSNAEEIAKLQKSDRYSDLYRLVSFYNDEDKSGAMGHPVTSNHDKVKMTVNSLQQQMTTYLAKEKAAMEERIRQYTEQQKQMYMNFQKKAYREKNALIGMVFEREEWKLKESLSEAMIESSISSPSRAILGSSPIVQSPPTKRPEYGELSIMPVMTRATPPDSQLESDSDSQKSPTTLSRQARSMDVDTLFDLDGFSQDCEPFFESDDDETDDNSLNEESLVSHHHHYQHHHRHISQRPRPVSQQYAQSVPISMPMWNRENSRSFDEDDERVPAPEPDKMVANMKALAQSVHDGTEMFGDLPRPRLNTGDFKKIRR